MAKNRPRPKQADEVEFDEVKERLNDRQLAFIEFYLADWDGWSGTKAALRAGYSPKTAQEQGSRLLSNVIVQAAIKQRLKDLQAESDEVITRLTNHSRASIGLFLNDDDELDLSVARKNGALPLIKKIKRTRRTESRKDKEPIVITTLEIELHDAQAALVQLARIRGLFVDKVVEVPWQEYVRSKNIDPATLFNGLVESAARAKGHAAAPVQQDDDGSSGRSGAAPSRPSAGGDG